MKTIHGDKLRGHLETLILSVLARGRGSRSGDPAASRPIGLRSVASEGGVALPGPLPARRGRRGRSRLGEGAAWTARGSPTHLSTYPQGKTAVGSGSRGLGAFRSNHRRHFGSPSMNDITEKELRIVVERAVRPVRTSLARKRRMRRGLAGAPGVGLPRGGRRPRR